MVFPVSEGPDFDKPDPEIFHKSQPGMDLRYWKVIPGFQSSDFRGVLLLSQDWISFDLRGISQVEKAD